MTSCPCKHGGLENPLASLPGLPGLKTDRPAVQPPDMERCRDLWDKYAMLENIRRHSALVAHIAARLAQWAVEKGADVDVEATRASGMLHDIAKTWTVRHGGSHAMIGASWTIMETHHYGVAQGVLLHVDWPWKLPEGMAICCLPLFVQYADKRVRHDQCVTVDERFEDLLTRYGKTPAAVAGIRRSWEKAKKMERELSRQLEKDLHENTFDCGRLVH